MKHTEKTETYREEEKHKYLMCNPHEEKGK
jgi:hypothetical protein